MDTFKKNTENFLNWLVKDINVKISPKIEIIDLRDKNQGRCVMAIDNIADHEVLFEISRDAILNIETCEFSKRYPDAKEKLYDNVGHWEGLILVLLYELRVVGNNSRWWPYFQVFPTKEDMNGLIYWNDEELKHLEPSLILDRIGKENAQKMFAEVKELIKEFKIEDESMKSIQWEDFVYVASVIMSYSFDVEDYEEDKETESENNDDQEGEIIEVMHKGETTSVREDRRLKSMIPLADTLNADTKKYNANLMYDDISLKMHATKTINKGDQIYNLYGEHPNSEILRRYGYVEEDGSKYDFGEVPLSTIEKVLQTQFKNITSMDELLKKLYVIIKENNTVQENVEFEDIVVDSCECYIDGEVPPECSLFLQILVSLLQIPDIDKMTSEELIRYVQRVSKKCFQLLASGKITKKCDDIWKMCIDERLSRYSSVDPILDTSKLHTVRDKSILRHLMASVVLKCEYESLVACKNAFSKKFTLIEDQKLMNNILKRKIEIEFNKSKKKRRIGRRQRK